MALREDFNESLADLGSGIVGLANRITNLPSADAITQADIDALKADTVALKELAVSNPNVPTDPTDPNAPAGTGSTVDGTPGQEPLEHNPFRADESRPE